MKRHEFIIINDIECRPDRQVQAQFAGTDTKHLTSIALMNCTDADTPQAAIDGLKEAMTKPFEFANYQFAEKVIRPLLTDETLGSSIRHVYTIGFYSVYAAAAAKKVSK
jgi:hypothetical protein